MATNKCRWCKGTGKLTLATSVVDCEECKSPVDKTGMEFKPDLSEIKQSIEVVGIRSVAWPEPGHFVSKPSGYQGKTENLTG